MLLRNERMNNREIPTIEEIEKWVANGSLYELIGCDCEDIEIAELIHTFLSKWAKGD